jgi:hypothetical protein
VPTRLASLVRSTSTAGLLAALWFAPTVHAAPLSVPKKGEKLQTFVPKGWAIESKLEGDLDGDGKADTVLVLLQKENEDDDRERALVVLLRRGAGWEVGGTNQGLVYGWMMGGVKGGDGQPTLEITKKGVLNVSQFGGSRQFYGSIHRFRWNKARGALELIGVDDSSGDGITGESVVTSCNLLTGVCTEDHTPAQVDEDGNEVESTPTHKTTRPGKKPLQVLEDVVGDAG